MMLPNRLRPKFSVALATAAASLAIGSAHAESIVGLTTTNQLFTTDTANLSAVSGQVGITGLATGTTISSIDFQPSTSTLFGLALTGGGTGGQLYTINPSSGAATAFGGALTFGGTSTKYSIDFNPVANAIRIVGNAGGNFRIPAATGVFNTDTTLAYSTADVNYDSSGTFRAAVVSAAYTRAVGGTTTLYDYDFNFSNFVTQGSLNGTPNSPNGGQLTSLNQTTGSSNLTAASNNVGFDISNTTGSAFASAQITTGGVSNLYSVNLSNGTTALLGNFGTVNVADFAVGAVPEPSTFAFALAGVALLTGVIRRRAAVRA